MKFSKIFFSLVVTALLVSSAYAWQVAKSDGTPQLVLDASGNLMVKEGNVIALNIQERCPDGKYMSGFETNGKIACETLHTYGWRIGSWSNWSNYCGDVKRTRTVQCKREDNQIVGDSFCAGDKPNTKETRSLSACYAEKETVEGYNNYNIRHGQLNDGTAICSNGTLRWESYWSAWKYDYEYRGGPTKSYIERPRFSKKLRINVPSCYHTIVKCPAGYSDNGTNCKKDK